MSNEFLQELQHRILVFDGATGTSFQLQNLTALDFGGEAYNGCNEYLCISNPQAVEKVHQSFLAVGADVIETNSFGSTSIVLAEYQLQHLAFELNKRSAQIARRMADKYSTPGKPRFVAGSMGPTTKLPSLGHISYRDMKKAYAEQALGLIEGGVDLLIVETCQDILQIKSALGGIFETFEQNKIKLPVIASVTVEITGTMLIGTEISAALTALEPYDIDVIGMNCATGPSEMSENIRYLAQASPKPIFCMPNAGLPENVGGHAYYRLTPDELKKYLIHFVKDLGVNIIGGCCGTRPEHIKALVDAADGLVPKKRLPEFIPSASSLYSPATLSISPPPVIVGERTNANGSRKFKELLNKEDWDGLVEMAKDQVREGAHILDVCVAYVGRNEVRDMKEVISRYRTQVSIPIMIDSTETPAIETALELLGGRCIINSINLEDGEERMNKICPMAKKFGAAVVALTIDETGMAKTADTKVAIAKRIYDLAVNKYGLRPQDLIFDTLTFTLGSGEEEFRKAGLESLQAIRRIKTELPGVRTLLGVSNISFGLDPDARQVLNSVFLHYAIEYGLDLAIVNASKIMPLHKIDPHVREICRQLIFDERKFENMAA